ncbi:MFS transporter [Streptomyces sp. NPDC059696]|uniref:MFS transporter n=1 Tax=Streptomyces sp. NPDC059696 TaxID=3346911 RepID=UPI0036BC9DE6
MKAFWVLTAASAVSMVGTTFLFVAAPLAILDTTESPALAVLSVAARTLPYLLGPLLGPLIDRYDRRVTFAVADLIQGAAVGAVPFFIAHDLIGCVFASLFVLGLANVASNVAADYGLIPALVPADRLQKATSHYNTAVLVARFIGPALGGMVIGTLGTTWALLIDAATFLLTASAATVLPRHPTGQRSDAAWTTMLREGFTHFRARPDLRRLTIALAVYNLGAGALEPTLITMGASHWSYSPGTMGLAVSCAAVAAAAGAWFSGRLSTGVRGHRHLLLWLTVCAAGAITLLVPWPCTALVGFCLVSLGEGGVNTVSMAYRQQNVTGDLAGRVNTIIRTFVMGAWAASALVLGLAADLFRMPWALLPVSLTAVGACWVWWRHTPPPTEEDLPLSPADARTQP